MDAEAPSGSKTEAWAAATEPIDLESEILRLCCSHPNGILDSEIQKLTNCNPIQRRKAVNRLLSQGRLELSKTPLGLKINLKSQECVEKIKGATREENAVYDLIKDSGNKGIWQRKIQDESNLPALRLNKVLKDLEKRKLVKSVKTVGAAKKKVYMLFELEPDETVSGGIFYSEQEFDSQFVDLLNQQCYKFLRTRAELARQRFPTELLARKKAALVTAAQVRQHIGELDISKVELSLEHVERVLDTLALDGKAEKECSQFRVLAPAPTTGLVRLPCTFCPVFSDCHPGGLISPASCQYFKEWLSQDF